MNYKVKKNNETFLIPKNLSEKSNHFYKKRYKKWEKASFTVYDVFSDKNKIFLDIGGWNGCTAIYASRMNSKVISVEPDPVALVDFHNIVNENKIFNLVVIEKPIYNKSEDVNFSPLEDMWNTSSSQIKSKSKSAGKIMKAITLNDIFNIVFMCNIKSINCDSVSIIKIDIEGGEQFLVQDIRNIPSDIPIYISLHLDWWNNSEDLNNWKKIFDKYKYIYATIAYGFEDGDSVFEIVSQDNILEYIKKNPFTSLVLTQNSIQKFPLLGPFRKGMRKIRDAIKSNNI